MATVVTNKLFNVKGDQVIWPDVGTPFTLTPGTIVWRHGSRRSSLGGYIGTFSLTYNQKYGLSPKPGPVFMLSMDNVEPIDETV